MVTALLHDAAADTVLHLLGEPIVTTRTGRTEIPDGSKRLLAFVALHRRPVDRRYAAGVLWPGCSDARSAGNLRSALWRLNGVGIPLLAVGKYTLATPHDLVVDAHVLGDWAARLIGGLPSPRDLAAVPSGIGALELLPGWREDWAVAERDWLRQRALHALETLSRQLISLGRCAEAVEAAMVAVGTDPLRESAQRALIESHLAEGNRMEARRVLTAYRGLLLHELGAEPEDSLTRLVMAREASVSAS
jgi:DNA-binding SARP family transcriptional activator